MSGMPSSGTRGSTRRASQCAATSAMTASYTRAMSGSEGSMAHIREREATKPPGGAPWKAAAAEMAWGGGQGGRGEVG